MLNKRYLYVLSIILILFLNSCDKKTENFSFLGEVDYYDDFLFYKYNPERISKTICFEFNEDAAKVVKFVKFGLFMKNDDGSYEPSNRTVKLYKNGLICDNNEFYITPKDKEVEVGFEFTVDAKEGIHKFFFKVLEDGGLDRVNEDFELAKTPRPILEDLDLRARKNGVWNPLALGLTWFVIIAITFFVLALVVVRLENPPFRRVSSISIAEPYVKNVRINGCFMVLCTKDNKVTQSFFSKLFKGRMCIEKNDFFTKDWKIVCKKGSLRPLGSNYTISPALTNSLVFQKHTVYLITNLETGNILKLQIN